MGGSLMNEVIDLLARIRRSPNHLSPSAYDTAWVAWLYPEAQAWLIEAQHPDGSWGAEVEYYHDRVIATLSAINAIAATSANGHDMERVERGIRYLEKAISHLEQDVFETIGFELLLPGLVDISRSLGLKIDQISKLIEPQLPLFYQKLSLIPEAVIYSPEFMVAHSLEFIGFEKLDQNAISQLRSSNGSIHNSPSATAFVEIAAQGSVEGSAYLDTLIGKYNGSVPGFAPFELFELIWAFHHISLNIEVDLLKPLIEPFIEFIGEAWTQKGVGFATTCAPDADDTSLGLRLLHEMDIRKSPLVLETYEVDDHFQCLPFERNISLDIHIHIIQALRSTKDFPRREEMLFKALNVLKDHLAGTEYIVDKWHISPYYSTSHAITSLIGVADNTINKPINWLLKTQRDNGSWTFYPGCPKAAVEETAYVLMALMMVYEKTGNIPFKVIEDGFRYLSTHYTSAEELPALWIHKALYNPYHIVDAVILSTMTKYRALTKSRPVKATT